MNIGAIRTKLGEGGRIIIPSTFRQNLHLNIGDEIVIHMQENTICITTPDQSLKKLQEKVKKHAIATNKNISLVDELISMRRRESEDE